MSITDRSKDLDLDPFDVYLDPRFDWNETPEAHVFIAYLPELKKEEVKVELEEGGVLKISGERKRDEEKTDTSRCIERCSFLRSFCLPENTNADGAKATMEKGILIVTVPKEEVKMPKVKSIEIFG